MKYNQPGSNYIGLFGYVLFGQVKNLGVSQIISFTDQAPLNSPCPYFLFIQPCSVVFYSNDHLAPGLTSRETEYVDEFARNYLNLGLDLLPLIETDPNPSDTAVQACFKAI